MLRPKINISPFKQFCFFSNFSYCSLVWHFTTSKSRLKVEKIQEQYLRLQLDNCINRYETLLTKSWINWLCILATEIFETFNGWNTQLMGEIFHDSPSLTHKTPDLHICTVDSLYLELARDQQICSR